MRSWFLCEILDFEFTKPITKMVPYGPFIAEICDRMKEVARQAQQDRYKLFYYNKKVDDEF